LEVWWEAAFPPIKSGQKGPTGQALMARPGGPKRPNILLPDIDDSIDDLQTRVRSTFEEFWNTYPRKAAKGAAIAAWKAALRRADAETIIEGARQYSEDPNRDPEFTAHAATWLR